MISYLVLPETPVSGLFVVNDLFFSLGVYFQPLMSPPMFCQLKKSSTEKKIQKANLDKCTPMS